MLNHILSDKMKCVLGNKCVGFVFFFFTLRRFLTLPPNIAQLKLLQVFDHFQLKFKSRTKPEI